MKRASRTRARGAALAEMALVLPFLFTLILGITDFGRLLSLKQDISDVARQAGNIVSRGGVLADGIVATTTPNSPFASPTTDGEVIVSTVTAHNSNDATPWVIDQQRVGGVTTASKIGALNAQATVPGFTTLTQSTTLTVVELYHKFTPAFPLLNIYPTQVYEVAVF